VNVVDEFLTLLAQRPGVLVRVARAEGSVPREPGAWMAVWAEGITGTVGGGHLEFEAIAHARQMLAGDASPAERRFPLGPALGQCCGGVVHLSFDVVRSVDSVRLREILSEDYVPVALFGGGHVGTALVGVLATLPLKVTWVDSRDEIFPPGMPSAAPSNVLCEHSSPVHAAVDTLAPQSRVLIMSFSHAEDLDVVAACLKRLRERDDLPYIGLIGSKTKWATFRHRLQARGYTDAELDRVTSPIGVPGIGGKEPQVIAVAVAAQILQTLPQR
jgi:xanthine dehydrogenase accessory factor